MSNEEIAELLERLGYDGRRLDAMLMYLKEYARRKALLEGGALTQTDIVSASLIFDGFNRKQKGA